MDNFTEDYSYYKEEENKEEENKEEENKEEENKEEENNFTKECDIHDFLNTKCKTDNQNDKTKENNIINLKNAISNHSIDSLLNEILKEGGEDITIFEEGIKYQLSSSSNQNNNEYKNISNIKLGKCEDKLKNTYNISANDSLLILKIDIEVKGLSAPIVEYEVYHPITKIKLDLNVCENDLINISIPVSINEDNLFKYDPNGEFYNDMCSTFTTEEGTDITLNDRKNEFISNNLSLCESDCRYINYLYSLKKAVCKCSIKNNISNVNEIYEDEEKFKKMFNMKNLINLEIMKCYKKLLTKEGIINNIGSYIILSIIFLYIIGLIYFVCIGYTSIINKIKKVINYKNTMKSKNINNINTQGETNKYKGKKNSKIKNEPNKNKKSNKNKEIKLNKNNKKIKNKRKKFRLNEMTNNAQKSKNSKSKTKSSLITINKSKKVNALIIINNQNENYKNKSKNNNSNIKKNESFRNDYELNILKYQEALIYDKRTFFQYYFSLIKTQHILFFALFSSNDYNSRTLKLCIFIFSFAQYYAVNALFFNESALHRIYHEEKGNYNIILQIPQILYSSLISSFINMIIKYFSLSEKNVIILKNNKEGKNIPLKLQNLIKCLIIKFTLFFIISFIFLGFFWYYLSCFCAVYKNTQIFLLKDTSISFGLSMIYPLIIYLLPGMLRLYSLSDKKKRKECLYKLSKIIQFI